MGKILIIYLFSSIVSAASFPYNDTTDADLIIGNVIPKDLSKFQFDTFSFSAWIEVYNIAGSNCIRSIDSLGIKKAFSDSHWCMNFMGPSEFALMNEKAFSYYESNKDKLVVMNYSNSKTAVTDMINYQYEISNAMSELCKDPSYADSEIC